MKRKVAMLSLVLLAFVAAQAQSNVTTNISNSPFDSLLNELGFSLKNKTAGIDSKQFVDIIDGAKKDIGDCLEKVTYSWPETRSFREFYFDFYLEILKNRLYTSEIFKDKLNTLLFIDNLDEEQIHILYIAYKSTTPILAVCTVARPEIKPLSIPNNLEFDSLLNSMEASKGFIKSLKIPKDDLVRIRLLAKEYENTKKPCKNYTNYAWKSSKNTLNFVHSLFLVGTMKRYIDVQFGEIDNTYYKNSLYFKENPPGFNNYALIVSVTNIKSKTPSFTVCTVK